MSIMKIWAFLGAVIASSTAASLAAVADEQQPAQPSTSLEEIVVTAQKREERLKDVPISISVLGGKDLDKSSFQGVTEALTSVPGVSAFPYNQGGGSSVAVRGVTTSYPIFAGPSPIAYYLDGVPFGLVDSGIAPDANAYDMDRVEVLRGPQGTLYGASALNGVVRVLTKDANLNDFEAKLRGSDSVTDGGGNNYRGDLAVNAPIVDGKLAVRAVIGYEDLSGWVDNPKVNNANDAVLRNARLKINAQPTDALSIGLSAWLSHQDYGAASQSDDQGRTTHLIGGEPISTDYGAYGLRIGYAFPAFTVTSNTSNLIYANHDEWDYGEDYFGFSQAIVERFHAHVFSEEINVNSSSVGPWRWSAGAIYRNAQNTNFQTLPAFVVPVTLDWTDTSKSYAVFGELSRRFLSDQLELTVGGRYFHDDVTTRENPDSTQAVPGYLEEASFNATTPRAVLTWHQTKDSTIYVSYSEGFRSGAPEPYYITGGVAGFPNVKPDKLHNYEVGAKADMLDRMISVDAAIYFMKWNDVQQQLTVPFNNTFVGAIVNGQSASGPGIDFGITIRPIERLEISANFSWNDLTVDSDVRSGSANTLLFAKGDRLNFSAKYTAGGSAMYAFPLGDSGFQGHISASVNYTSPLSDRGITGGETKITDGNSMVVSRAAFSVHSPVHWEASLYADNINNERGAVYRLPLTLNPDTSARIRPRTVGVQFDYKY